MYIKLDNKLTVNIDSILINNSNDNQAPKPISDIQQILDNLFAILKYFNEIEIKNLTLNNNQIYIKYNKNLFLISSNDIVLETILFFDNPRVGMDIKRAYYKKYNVMLDGRVDINIKDETLAFALNIYRDNVKLSTQGSVKENKIELLANTNMVNSIETIKKLLSDEVFSKSAKEWTFDRVKASDYTLKYFYISMDRDFNVDLKSIKAVLVANNATIKFQDDLQPIKVGTIYTVLSNDNLIFTLQNVKHKDRPLDGSEVSIVDLYNDPILRLKIKTTARLDDEMLKLVSFYGVKIPVKQLDSKSDVAVDVDYNLNTEDTKVSVLAHTKNSNLKLFDVDLYAKDLSLEVVGNDIFIHNADVVYSDLLDANLKGTIDLEQERIVGDLFINKAKLSDIVDMQDVATPIDISYKNDITVSLNKLNTNIVKNKTSTEIMIHTLKELNSYLPIMAKSGIINGDVGISTKDFEDYSIRANITDFDSILHKNGNKVTQLNLNIKHTKDKTEIYTDNRDINILARQSSTDMKLENYDVRLNLDSNSSDNSIKNTYIMMHEGNIYIKKHKLTFGLLKAYINEKIIQLSIQYKDSILRAQIEDKNVKLDGKKLGDEFVNNLFDTKKFNGGEFNVNAQGTKSYITGTFTAKDTEIKDFLLINNLISFINSLPLLTANPLFIIPSVMTNGFNASGYQIKWAEVFFGLNDKKLILNNLSVYSDTTDIKGSGVVDFETKQIDLKLSVSILKNFTSILEHIPLVGYILLGKDGTVSINVAVKGTLQNPTYDTSNTLGDAIKAPINIIERTITLPFGGAK